MSRRTPPSLAFPALELHFAGLLLEGHTCGRVQVDWDVTDIRHALEAFPLDLKEDGDTVTCRGMCPGYLSRILQIITGQ